MIAVSRTADALSTLMAIKEGDKGSILMSAVSILPIGKGLKLAEEGGEDALKAAKVTSAAIEEGKAVSKKPSLLCRVKKIFGLKGCFVAGTLVASEKGYKKIETIKVGDKVWSKDVNTGKIELKKVVKLYKHKVNSIVHLKINGKEIRTTINHPFYVAGQGWVQAGKLKKGNIVYTLDGKKETVESAETEEADEDEETVFNFQVEEYHTYFVGEDKILVHNNCEDDAAAAAKALETSKGVGEATVPKRPGGYVKNDIDKYENLSPQVNRAPGNKNIAADNRVQAHHPIQNEWAERNVPGYDKGEAPAMLLESSSGNPHAKISAAQRARRRLEGYDTDIVYEFNTSYREMIDAGVDAKSAKKAIRSAYKYFDGLGGFK